MIPANSIIKYFKTLEKEGFKGDYVEAAQNFFGCSELTVRRRLKSIGVSHAKYKHIVELDPELIDEAYAITDKVVHKEYKLEESIFIEKPEGIDLDTRPRILMVSDIQVGYLKTPHGYIVTETSKNETLMYFEKLKEQILKEFLRFDPSEIRDIDFTIALLGDLVDGEIIYRGQENFPVEEQLLLATQVVYDLITYIHSFGFKSVRVLSVAGNHGRLHQYYSEKSNWDSIITAFLVKILEERMKYDDSFGNVTIDYNRALYQMHKIGKWNFLLHHGNLTKGGLNYNSIENKLESLKLYDHKEMDAAILAHYHTLICGETFHIPFVINGCTYPSDFVHKVIGKTESLAFGLITVGDEKPIKELKILDLRLDRDKK